MNSDDVVKKTFNKFPRSLDAAIHLRAFHDGETQEKMVIAILKREFAREMAILQDTEDQALQEPNRNLNA